MHTPSIKVYYDEAPINRLEYIFHSVLASRFNAEFKLVQSQYKCNSNQAAIFYTRHPPSDHKHVWIKNSLRLNFQISEIDDIRQMLSKCSDPHTLEHDIPLEIFYHLSRAEEYIGHRDEHNRWSPKLNGMQPELLMHPRVDFLIEYLFEKIQAKFMPLESRMEFRYIATYDIDFPWAFDNKSLANILKISLGSLYRKNWKRLKDQYTFYLNKSKKDPYQDWSDIQQLHQQKDHQCILFVLLSERSKFDPAIPYISDAYHDLVQSWSQWSQIGIHPSYASNGDRKIRNKEIKRFNHIMSSPPATSRQHYLKLQLPNTYRNLCNYDIKEDYTMVHADYIGFRARTCHPFYWYDIEKDILTNLKIMPTTFMDVTLKNYLGLKSEEAYEKMLILESEVRKYKGTLISLWHNSSFYAGDGWTPDWREVYKTFIKRM